MSDELSCDISQFFEQIKGKKRIAVTFVGKDFPATESYINALGEAYDQGYFGEMEMAIIPVDSPDCDKLAEHEKVDVIPRTCIYKLGKQIGCLSPNDSDATVGYRKAIEGLIDLSED